LLPSISIRCAGADAGASVDVDVDVDVDLDAPPRAATVSCANCHSRRALPSQLNIAARASPRARSRARRSGSVTIAATASASAASSPSGTSTAAPPLTSRSAGTSVVTTGVPHAIASTTGRPKPSKCDGYASTSAPP
jgi:hypothetical protein